MRERQQRPTGLVTRDRTVATLAGVVDEPAHSVDWHAGTMRLSQRAVKPADRHLCKFDGGLNGIQWLLERASPWNRSTADGVSDGSAGAGRRVGPRRCAFGCTRLMPGGPASTLLDVVSQQAPPEALAQCGADFWALALLRPVRLSSSVWLEPASGA